MTVRPAERLIGGPYAHPGAYNLTPHVVTGPTPYGNHAVTLVAGTSRRAGGLCITNRDVLAELVRDLSEVLTDWPAT